MKPNTARGLESETDPGEPGADPSGAKLALDLLRLAAQVLDAAGRLKHVDAGWVDRHIHLPRESAREQP